MAMRFLELQKAVVAERRSDGRFEVELFESLLCEADRAVLHAAQRQDSLVCLLTGRGPWLFFIEREVVTAGGSIWTLVNSSVAPDARGG